jgi:hypothetical protein
MRITAFLVALSSAACAASTYSNLYLVVKHPEGEITRIDYVVVKEGVRARDCHIAWDSQPGPTIEQMVALALKQAPGANAIAGVSVVQQIRNFRPWFFDRYCVEVSGDAVQVGEPIVDETGRPALAKP